MSSADIVFINGKIFTLDAKPPWAQAVAIIDDRIVAVGSSSDVTATMGTKTEIIDLNGKLVLPGFVDSHAHVSAAPNQDAEADLYNLLSKSEIISRVKRFASTHPDYDVIYGSGWKNELFGPRGPEKSDLDAIVPDRPVLLTSEDGHSAWVNSNAIEQAGVTAIRLNPPGGMIEKIPGTDEPSGTFRETARDLIQNSLPPLTVDQVKGSIQNFMLEAAKVGITTAHDPLLVLPDASGQLNGFGYLRNNIQAFSEISHDQKMSLRVRGAVLTDPSAGIGQLERIESAFKDNSTAFQLTGIKIFVDGVVEAGTAYLLEPYQHLPDRRGEPLWSPESLNELVTAADHRGLQIHFHAIGDAAVRMSLESLEHARRINGTRDSRHLITHLHVVDHSDIARMAALNVVAVPQPFWHVKGDYFRDIEAKYLGYDRAENAYPMKSLAKAGICLAAASDYPVQVPSPPLLGIMLGITRCEPGEADPNEILGPQERMTLEEMIASFTINGAYANFLEHDTGSIKTGKKADLVVLKDNLFEIPIAEIAETKILATMFEGKVVYRDPSL